MDNYRIKEVRKGMEPKLVIVALGNTTNVFLEGRQIGKGVENLIYSARNNKGELNPTLKLLEVNVKDFSFKEGGSLEDFLKDISQTRELLSGVESAEIKSTPDRN